MDVFIQTFVKPFGKVLKRGKERLLKSHSKKSGVYIIKENGIIVYVGMSNHCVVKACYRHFYPWQDCYRGMGREYRTTYYDQLESNDYEVIIIVTNKDQSGELEKSLIISISPRDNREKYESYFSSLVEDAVNKKGLTLHSNTGKTIEGEEDDMPF